MNFLSRLRHTSAGPVEGAPHDLAAELVASQTECADLKRRLADSETHLRERTELLYDTQRQYASEHFNYQENFRELKTQRLRVAGALADRDVMMSRFEMMKTRIAFLLERLRQYEPCEGEWIDTTPIVEHKP